MFEHHDTHMQWKYFMRRKNGFSINNAKKKSRNLVVQVAGISIVLLSLICAGCGKREDSVPVSNDDQTAMPDEVKPGEAASNAQTTGISVVGNTNGGTLQTLNAVRTGAQAGMDRIVFEFSDTGLPEWEVKYVEPKQVTDCGSGEQIAVAGNAWLQITFRGASAHTDSGIATSGPNRRVSNQIALRELVRTCDFEGEVTWVAGIMRENEYIPRALTGPSRLVIDIAH